MEKIEAVIIAGGKGTRLSKYTGEIPKPMVELNGKPVLEYQIEVLKNNNICNIAITVGHLKEIIIDYFGTGEKFGVNIIYITEDFPLGTGGALYYLKNKVKENFFVVFGDIIFDIDIHLLSEFHINNNAMISLVTHPNSHPFDSDLVVCNNDGQVVSMIEKNDKKDAFYCNLVNSGAYMFNEGAIDLIQEPKKIDIEKDVIVPNINNNNIYSYKTSEYLKDMGTYDRLSEVESHISKGIVSKRKLSNLQKCIFLDRDGTINRKNGLICKPEQLELEDSAATAISKINHSGYLCIVISNQPVIARNLCTFDELSEIHNKMETLLGNEGAFIDDIYFCPHHPDSGYPEERKEYKIECDCRKPKIGMIMEAKKKYNIDLDQSFIIGDTTTDIMTGINANLKTVLVNTGDKGLDGKYDISADIICENVNEAVEYILANERK